MTKPHQVLEPWAEPGPYWWVRNGQNQIAWISKNDPTWKVFVTVLRDHKGGMERTVIDPEKPEGEFYRIVPPPLNSDTTFEPLPNKRLVYLKFFPGDGVSADIKRLATELAAMRKWRKEHDPYYTPLTESECL